MNSVAKAPVAWHAKIMLAVFVIVGVIRMADFIFYGYALQDACSGIGFALLAYGVYTNGVDAVSRDRAGRYALVAGSILVLVAAVVRFVD